MKNISLNLPESILAQLESIAKQSELPVETLLEQKITEYFDFEEGKPDYLRLDLEDDLTSEKGIDYKTLRYYLSKEYWVVADYETYLALIKCCGLLEGQDISNDSKLISKLIMTIPCQDLKTIDRLWLKYSNGHFGFSIQKKIYVHTGGCIPGQNMNFFNHIGWSKKEGEKEIWLKYYEFIFDKSAPKGHLPTSRFGGDIRAFCYNTFGNLFLPRLTQCEL